jgi:hypothetical protein
MRSHTTVGGEIFAKSRLPVLRLAREIALYHHERWDGTGYPQRLEGDQIPLAGRIVAIVDAFDALTHGRTYKKAVSFEEAKREIRSVPGSQFDPQLVEVFLKAMTPQVFQDLNNMTPRNHARPLHGSRGLREGRGSSLTANRRTGYELLRHPGRTSFKPNRPTLPIRTPSRSYAKSSGIKGFNRFRFRAEQAF